MRIVKVNKCHIKSNPTSLILGDLCGVMRGLSQHVFLLFFSLTHLHITHAHAHYTDTDTQTETHTHTHTRTHTITQALFGDDSQLQLTVTE